MDNSASKLLSILEICRKQSKSRSCVDTWKEVLEVSSHTELVGALGEFLSLADNAAKEVLSVHPDESGVEYWKLRIFKGFYSASLSRPWAEFIQHVDDVTIFTLRSHAALIAGKRPMLSASSESLKEISDLLEQATILLMELALADEEKSILLTRIEQLKCLINRYRFVSPSAVMDAAKVLAAELVVVGRNQPEVVRDTKFYSTLKESLELLANATQVASSTPMVIGVSTFLLGLVP